MSRLAHLTPPRRSPAARAADRWKRAALERLRGASAGSADGNDHRGQNRASPQLVLPAHARS